MENAEKLLFEGIDRCRGLVRVDKSSGGSRPPRSPKGQHLPPRGAWSAGSSALRPAVGCISEAWRLKSHMARAQVHADSGRPIVPPRSNLTERGRKKAPWVLQVDNALLPPPQAALRRLIRRLPLQPALHSSVLADGDVEPQPRRAPEMGTKDRARREHDANGEVVMLVSILMSASSLATFCEQATKPTRKRSVSSRAVGTAATPSSAGKDRDGSAPISTNYGSSRKERC